MLTFLFNIIRATPIWVWVILIALAVLGVRQLRDRTVNPISLFIAPLVFLAIGLASSGRHGAALGAWLVVALITTTISAVWMRAAAGARYDMKSALLHIPGSAKPMFFMLSIFLFNYVAQVTFAIDPVKATSALWQIGFSVITGALTGVFLGRAISLYRLRTVAMRSN